MSRARAAGTINVGGVALTEAESRLLKTIVGGACSNKAAARELKVLPSTINAHLRAIFHKLGVRSRVAAAVWAVRNGVA